jgi:hypothetical protein
MESRNHPHLAYLLKYFMIIAEYEKVCPAGDFCGHLSYTYDRIPFWNNGYQMIILNLLPHLRKNFVRYFSLFLYSQMLPMNYTTAQVCKEPKDYFIRPP